MKSLVFVTYYWGGKKYKEYAAQWKKHCKAVGVQCYIEELQQFAKAGLYQKGINHKPKFILKMLEKFPRKAVVYMDIDMILLKKPTLFANEHNVDLMCMNWNHDPAVISNGCTDPLILETAGGIFYFNNTNPAKRVLKLWLNAISQPQYNKCADDRVLALMFHKHRLIELTRVQWLPIEYFYVPQFFKSSQLENAAVICHPEAMTTEELAADLGASNNRIPIDYKVQYSVRNKAKKMKMNAGSEPLGLEKRLKKVGFKFMSTYKLPSGNIECTTSGVQRFPLNTPPDELIKFWESEGARCDIILGKYTRKTDLDMASDAFEHQTGTLKFKSTSNGVYLRRNDNVFTLLKHWEKMKTKTDNNLRNLESAFNLNASHRMKLRYGP